MAKNMAKRNFIVSLTSLGLSAAMMVGTTFAWFTDTATSGGNIIQTGKLDVKMSYSTALGGEYLDVEAENTPPVFNYTNWEPGYSDVKYVKIENEGSLAFQYSLDIVPMMLMADGEVDLADVIDVSVAVADGTATSVGTLSEIFEGNTPIAKGELYSATVAENDTTKTDEIIYRITMKMNPSAGSEYMGLNVGDGFDLRLYATQYTYEKDSLGDQYDQDANLEKLPIANVTMLDVDTVNGGEAITLYNVENFSQTGETTKLDTAYEYVAPDTSESVQNSPYKDWIVDFVVSFNQDVVKDSAGLAGSYGSFLGGAWIGFTSPIDIEAGEEIALLHSTGLTLWTYEAICSEVETFKCGAFDVNDGLSGATITVELRLYDYETDETGQTYITINTMQYTFQ